VPTCERQQSADAEAALGKLASEQETLSREAAASSERRAGVEERATAADAALAASEAIYAELTAALADLAAKRNQLDAAIRDNAARRARLETELGEVTAELDALMADAAGAINLDGLAAAAAQAAVTGAGRPPGLRRCARAAGGGRA
jgi:chromosome segregation protein